VDTTPPKERYDADRTAWLEGQGFRVLRFWNNDVLAAMDVVLETIYEALIARA